MRYSLTYLSVLAFTIITLLICTSVHIVSGRKLTLRVGLTLMLIQCLWAGTVLLFMDSDSPVKMVVIILVILASYAFAYGMRGSELVLKTFTALMCTFGGDILAGMYMLSAYDSETILAARTMSEPITIQMQLITGGSMILLALCARCLANLRRMRQSGVGYLLRPLLLLLIVGGLFARAMVNLSGGDQTERLQQALPDFIFIILLLAVGITYIRQDVRFFQQAQENQQLLHQQSLQSLLLEDTRIFRHNAANMIYGLQGTLLSGDAEAVSTYYRQMVEQCQLINNENVVALRRIPSLPVTTLLVNKLSLASQQRIPFIVTVSEDVKWRTLRESDLTQMLGVMLDNALEAAAGSAAPYVAFEACNVDGALSLTVRNTCPPGEMPVFGEDIPSTKPGHSGLGLKSLRRMAARHRNVLFNIYPVGRYVEASLTIY